ncbi:MerR family transcriptional regulator [Gracilibacillus alcaliphilus]|uniref:MerR family transcriptional regulator n=1 Tax=Gracilibacillus alcaliphilus TaxID=1401441 RepID=UPI0019582889|nr:MerR family transcriptional regulator [Gracilibacillus alcaliphilus]MBM7678850.1 DNA-binding transcriptional MerR regulator [Gracilibacillus alcaliphilus]
MYSTGEVAKKMNITVRTLRYYDEINLLNPSYTAESGYRFYSKSNIVTLQRIIALKELGFPLSKIKTILDQKNWENVFEEQLMLITKEKERLRYLEKTLRLSQHLSQIGQDISWRNIFQFTKQTEEDRYNNHLFIKQYFDERELDILKKPSLDLGRSESKELVEMLKTAKEQKNEDPESLKSQHLAYKLVYFLENTFYGDSALIEKYWMLQKQPPKEGNLFMLDDDVIYYIESIMDCYETKWGEVGKSQSYHRE